MVGGCVLLYKLCREKQSALDDSPIRNSDEQPTGVDEPSNNLFDPVNTRGVYDVTNPVEYSDEGPFGVPRQVRVHQAGFTFPTFGSVLTDY